MTTLSTQKSPAPLPTEIGPDRVRAAVDHSLGDAHWTTVHRREFPPQEARGSEPFGYCRPMERRSLPVLCLENNNRLKEQVKMSESSTILTFRVERSPTTGYFLATCDQHTGHLVVDKTLAEVLAKVTPALHDLLSVGPAHPDPTAFEGVDLSSQNAT